MSDISESARKEMHRAIEQAGDIPTDAVLVAAVVVAEWADAEGDRWISRIATTDGGDRTPPTWTSEGLLHNALYGDWSEDEEDEE